MLAPLIVAALSATPCAYGAGGYGVTIASCSFTLQPSPGGNSNYYVIVTIGYTAPPATSAVRFRCMLGDGGAPVAEYGVLRKSGTSLTFVSPFVSANKPVSSVQCFVDKT